MKNREELERLIVDASDGILNPDEIKMLEVELQNHPDLLDDYKAIMNLSELINLYRSDLEIKRHQSSINRIKKRIRSISNRADSFEVVTLDWFRRYALAASLAVFAVTSIFSFVQMQNLEAGTEEIAEEYFYPLEDQSVAENYVIYLENLAEE